MAVCMVQLTWSQAPHAIVESVWSSWRVMMTGDRDESSSLAPVDNPLSKQAGKIIDEDTWVDLPSLLDASFYEYLNPCPDRP